MPRIIYRNFDRNVAMRRVNAEYDRLVAAMKLPTPQQRDARLTVLADQVEQLSEKYDDALDWAAVAIKLLSQEEAEQVNTVSNVVVELVMILAMLDFSHMSSVADRTEMLEDLERVAIALGGYRAEHGRYPESLEALVPDLLAAVPQDIFDTEGGHVRYLLEDDRVVIYSVGPNGEDNGGVDFDDFRKGDLGMAWPR
ncbi:MAG: hypothetical protein WD294_15675 [Phycisphaeraceae bacterium]